MAQNQKTDTSEAFADLTPEQVEFVINVAAGDSQSEAYRKAYQANGYSPAALRVQASRLRHRPNVSLALDALSAEGADTAKVTLENHLTELDRLAKRAEIAGNFGAAVNAQVNRGKAAGLYVEKTQDVTEDPISILERVAKVDPGLAQRMAEAKGIEWKPETRH